MSKTTVPPYHALMNPLLKALKALGGSATNEELGNKLKKLSVGMRVRKVEVEEVTVDGDWLAGL